jgi:hypothetical protein
MPSNSATYMKIVIKNALYSLHIFVPAIMITLTLGINVMIFYIGEKSVNKIGIFTKILDHIIFSIKMFFLKIGENYRKLWQHWFFFHLDPPELSSSLKSTTDDIIDSLVCPPPPSDNAINEDIISSLIVPAPGRSKQCDLGPMLGFKKYFRLKICRKCWRFFSNHC